MTPFVTWNRFGIHRPAGLLRGAYTLLLVLAGLLTATLAPEAAWAQDEVFNRYATQPDVWRQASPTEPGVDARGDLGLSIPVLTVPGRGGLDYEVRFSYASGIRFDERGSWIGTGWSFDPGSIVRDVHGSVVVPENGVGKPYNVDYAGTEPPAHQADAYYVTTPAGSSTMVRAVSASALPPRPSGYSSSTTSGFYLTEWKAWRIEARSSGPVVAGGHTTCASMANGPCEARDDFSSFVVTADDGTRYVFGHATLATHLGTTHNLRGYANERYVSTWRLGAILGPDYDGPEIPMGDEAGSWIRLEYSAPETALNEGAITINPLPLAQSAYLTRIVTPTHEAVIALSPRSIENFPDWSDHLYSKLGGITLYERTEPTTAVRRVVLDHTNRFQHPYGSGSQNSRLALDQIHFFGRGDDGPEEPGYRFTYHGLIGGGGATNDNMDHFGFYDTIGTVGTRDFSANKEDGASHSLLSITYPTGGRDEFTYQSDHLVYGFGNGIPFRTCEYNPDELEETCHDVDQHYLTVEETAWQGGARVLSIKRYDGMTPTTPAVTTYSYPPEGGYASGVPPRYWDKYEGLLFYAPNERGRAAVYYNWIARGNADGSTVRTEYTTSNTSGALGVRQLATLVWRTPESGVPVNVREAMTLVQGNQDWAWGRPKQVDYQDPTGRSTQRVTRTYDLAAETLARVWRRGPTGNHVSVEWGYDGHLAEERTRDYGQSGSVAAESITKYTYFNNRTSTISKATGNGLVQTVTLINNDGRRRRTAYLYGSERYTELATANRLSPVVREDVLEVNAAGTPLAYHAASVTTWGDVPSPVGRDDAPTRFAIHRRYAWNANAPASQKQDFLAWGTTAVPGTAWQLKERVASYNADMLPTSVVDGRGFTTTLTYDAAGRVTAAAKPATVGATPLERRFTYEPGLGLLTRIEYEDRHKTDFAYDAAGRLIEVRNDRNQLTVQYAYAFPRDGNGLLIPSQPTKVTTTRFTGGTPDRTTEIAFFDGLGRPIQTQEAHGDGNYSVLSHRYLPGSTAGSGSPASERVNTHRVLSTGGNYQAFSWGNSPPCVDLGSEQQLYTETCYTRDGLGRVARVSFPKDAGLDARVRHRYLVGSVDGKSYLYTETTDESGDVTRAYTDAFGHAFREVCAPGTPVEATPHTVFDVAGRAVEVRPPNYFAPPHGQRDDWRSLYLYDTQGRLRERTTPDAGTVRFKYDASGLLRFAQDANREEDGEVVFTLYDGLGRATASGIKATSFQALDPTQSYAWESQPDNWTEANAYDAEPSAGLQPWSAFAAQLGAFTPIRPTAHLVATVSQSGGVWQLALSDYGEEGRLDKRRLHTQSEPGGPVLTAYDTELVYTRDRQVRLIERRARMGAGLWFSHRYAYNGRGLLDKIYAGPGQTPPQTPSVAYTYTPAGSVATVKYGMAPSISHLYDLRQRLTRIGEPLADPSPTNPFSAEYVYGADGTVVQAAFYHRYPTGTPTSETRDWFEYRYDGLDRLSEAVHYDEPPSCPDCRQGSTGGSVGVLLGGASNAYKVSGITYDRNGNLVSLTRHDQTGVVLDQLTYHYTPGTNRIASLAEAAGATQAGWDAEAGSFGYDRNGNATVLPGPYLVTAADYDERNLAVSMTVAGSGTTEYRYASSGQRYFKGPGAEAVAGVGGAPGGTAAPSVYPPPGSSPPAARYGARFGRSATRRDATRTPADAPAARRLPSRGGSEDVSAAVVEPEYTALDALSSAGTQPEVGALTSMPEQHFNVLTPSGEVVGREQYSAGRYYYHKDLLGSVRAVVDETGEVIEARMYDAWGVLLEGREGDAGPDAAEGYTGKRRDREMGGEYAGLDYFGARAYSSVFGRFLSVDPLAGDYPEWSPYTYTLDNPLSLVDPNGAAATPPDWYHIGGQVVWRDHTGGLFERGKTYQSLGRNVLVGWHNRDPETLEEPINSAQFELYLETNREGPTASINGNTVPANPEKYGTLQEGLYPARSQGRASPQHRGERALIIGEGGPLPTVRGNSNNPANTGRPISEHIMTEVFFHIGNTGRESLTYTRRDGTPGVISAGCQTGPHGSGSRARWNAFMENVPRNFRGNYYLPKQPRDRND